MVIRRLWLMVLLSSSMVVFAGCSSDSSGSSETDETDAGADAMGDVGEDAGTVEDTGNICGDRTPCAGNSDCDPDTEFCSNGCCEAREVTPICSSQGSECLDSTWSTDVYFCNLPTGGGVGTCLSRCLTSGGEVTDPDGCDSGYYCIALDETLIVNTATAYLDGACLEGDCNDACFEIGGDCSEDDLFTCLEGTGTCWGVGNDASFCFQGGTQGLGDECLVFADVETDACQAGLFCLAGECVAPCAYDEDDPASGCTGDESCVPVFQSEGDNHAGICSPGECGEYNYGDCPEGSACEPYVGLFSGQVNTWGCTAQPEDAELVGYLEECDADGSDGFDTACSEGMVCIPSILDDGTGVCEQFCDPHLEIDDGFGACPPGDALSLIEDDVYIAEGVSSGYFAVAEGDYDLQIAFEEGELADGGSASIEEEEASTWIVWSDGEEGFGLSSWVDAEEGDDAPEAGNGLLSFYNVHGTTLDVFVAGAPIAEDLADRASSDWVDVDPSSDFASTDAGLTWTTRPASSEDGTSVASEIILFGDGSEEFPLSIASADATALELGADEAAIRLFNASPDPIEIWADWVDSDDDDGAVSYGVATEWVIVDTTALTGDLAIDFKETDDAGDIALAYTEDLAAGDVTTVVLFWNSTLRAVEIEGAGAPTDEEMYGLRVSNFTGDVASFWLGAPLALDVEHDTVWGDEVAASDWTLLIGADDRELGDAPLAVADITTEDGMVTSLAAAWNEGWLSFVWSETHDWPDFDSLDGDAGLIRFINLTDSAARLEYFAGGGQLCVDLDWFGGTAGALGRCQDQCDPYLYTEFADGDESNGRWETSGCNHNDDVVYGCLGYLTTNDNETPAALEGDPDLTGFCVPRLEDDADGDFGDDCTSTGDGGCNPDSWCVGVTETTSECTKLCQPFSGDAESDCFDRGVCHYTTFQGFGFCVEDYLDLEEGEACSPADTGEQCNGDDLICLGFSETEAYCSRLCQEGIDETCPMEGTDCIPVFSDALPPHLGACLEP